MSEPSLEDISCLNLKRQTLELKSTVGHHCDVWQISNYRIRRRKPYDLVVKKYRQNCTMREVEVLDKDYRRLKSNLEDIVPNTIFVPTCGGDGLTVLVVSHAVSPWFNIANPINEPDAVPLLKKLPKAKNQLLRFCHAARKWEFEKPSKIIDLYGLDNLVLDTNREIRYLDSFHVFFYTDMFQHLDQGEDALLQRIEISIRRREYLEYLLEESKKKK